MVQEPLNKSHSGGLLTLAPGVELLNGRALSDRGTARLGGLSVISANTQARRRPVSSCQVKGRINKSDSGDAAGPLVGPRSPLKQDAPGSSADWKSGTKSSAGGEPWFSCTNGDERIYNTCITHFNLWLNLTCWYLFCTTFAPQRWRHCEKSYFFKSVKLFFSKMCVIYSTQFTTWLETVWQQLQTVDL